jgi:nitrogen regulatory protein PII
MNINAQTADYELIYVIVNHALGSKVMQKAKQHNIKGGTIYLGRGTLKNRVLEFFGITDERKEIVVMAADTKTADEVIDALDKEFHFQKPHHGIAFTIPVCGVFGSATYKCDKIHMERGASNTMYNLVTTIVDRGKGEFVVDAATKAGAKGATIVNARGSGIHETNRVFAMAIEPEKEMVYILVKDEITEAVVSSIRKELKIDEPGKGIIFVQSVKKTYGLHE